MIKYDVISRLNRDREHCMRRSTNWLFFTSRLHICSYGHPFLLQFMVRATLLIHRHIYNYLFLMNLSQCLSFGQPRFCMYDVLSVYVISFYGAFSHDPTRCTRFWREVTPWSLNGLYSVDPISDTKELLHLNIIHAQGHKSVGSASRPISCDLMSACLPHISIQLLLRAILTF